VAAAEEQLLQAAPPPSSPPKHAAQAPGAGGKRKQKQSRADAADEAAATAADAGAADLAEGELDRGAYAVVSAAALRRDGPLVAAGLRASSACLLLSAMDRLSPTAAVEPPHAQALAAVMTAVARGIFEALPLAQGPTPGANSSPGVSDVGAAAAAGKVPEAEGPDAPLALTDAEPPAPHGQSATAAPSHTAFTRQFQRAAEPVADLLRMSMLAAGLIPSGRKDALVAAAARLREQAQQARGEPDAGAVDAGAADGGDAASAAAAAAALPARAWLHSSEYAGAALSTPIRQLAVTSALALGAQPDAALEALSVDALMSLLVAYSVGARLWRRLSGEGDAAPEAAAAADSEGATSALAPEAAAAAAAGWPGSPEQEILVAAAARLRQVLLARGLSPEAQVAALRTLPSLAAIRATGRFATLVVQPPEPVGLPPHLAATAFDAPITDVAAAGAGAAAPLT
jgi:hypothetical protein